MPQGFEEMKDRGLEYLRAVYGEEAVERAVGVTAAFTVEVPGWQLWEGFGGGGRFEGGGSGGAARTTAEIAEDVGFIQSLTRSTPTVGQHILWFFSDDGVTGGYAAAERVAGELSSRGLSMGSISPTYFLAGSGDASLTSRDAATRERYVEQTVLGARIAAELGNGLLTLWFPDGTNYPGQRGLQEKIGLLADSLSAFWDRTPADVKGKLTGVLVEYKVFEPGTYSTTVPDWGTARELSRIFGDTGGVLVDLGHHHHGTNIEQIVGNLIAFGVRGGFHFNTRYAADDDHSVQADYEMARIFHELLEGNVLANPDPGVNWAFALDQMARTEQRIPSVLKSVDALKRSVAKAALMDAESLEQPRKSRDLIAANVAFERSLLHADTAPIVMESYARRGLHPSPLAAYRESGYQERIERERSKAL